MGQMSKRYIDERKEYVRQREREEVKTIMCDVKIISDLDDVDDNYSISIKYDDIYSVYRVVWSRIKLVVKKIIKQKDVSTRNTHNLKHWAHHHNHLYRNILISSISLNSFSIKNTP